MDSLNRYRQTIEKILSEYAAIPYAYGDIKTEVVFDHTHNHYLLMNTGWDGDRRIHGCVVHLDIIDNKIWIQRDGTEHGIADDLTKAGIPAEQIVLGFREAELRQHTGYAIA